MGGAVVAKDELWTTDHVGHVDRFEYWREVLCANMIGVTAEAPREYRKDFSGSVKRTAAGELGVVSIDMKLSHLQTNRSARDIGEKPGDGVFLFRATTFDTHFQFKDREDFVAPRGSIVMGGLDRERHSIAPRPGEYKCAVVRLPGSAFKGLAHDVSVLEPRLVAHESGADRLLDSFYNSVLRELPHLSADEGSAALQTLVNLATLALRGSAKIEEPVRDAIRAARLRRAYDYINAHAYDVDLSAEQVAAALGFSIRLLHSIFEEADKSFSQYVMMLRVARATRMVEREPLMSISQVAFACGFDSLATFYRSFRRLTGRKPMEMRALAAERALYR